VPHSETWKKILLWISPAVFLAVIINPYANIDALIIGAYLMFAGHVYLQEKLLLAFLLIRPTVDQWRNLSLITYHSFSINLNAALSLLFLAWGAYMLWQEYVSGATPQSFSPYRREQKKGTIGNMVCGNSHQHNNLKSQTENRKFILFLFSFFILLSFVSLFWSVTPGETLIETIKLANLALFFWLGYLFIKKDAFTMRELIGTIWLSAALPIAVGAIQLFSGAGLTTFGLRGRIYGTLAHPNVFAFLLLSLIIIYAKTHIINYKNLKSKIINLKLIVLFSLIILLVFTYSRAAIIGLLLFFLITAGSRSRKLFSLMASAIILFYVVFFPLHGLLLDKYNINLQQIPIIGRLTGRNEDADSLEWRQSLLRQTAPLIAARPFFGYGFGTFQQVWIDNRSLKHQWDDSAEAHNDYLRIVVELGFAGLFSYILLLTRLLAVAKKNPGKLNKIKINYTKLNTINFVQFFSTLFNSVPQNRIHLFAWILVFMIVSLSDNMLHHTPVMWLTFAYWGAALGEK